MTNLFSKKQLIIKSKNNENNNNNISEITQYNTNNTTKFLYSPSWKEWNNSVYTYNKNYIKSFTYKDKIINLLFKTYSNLTKNLLLNNSKRLNYKRFSSNKIFLSKAEMKHTNNNVIITLFIFNKNKNFIKYKLNKLQSNLFKIKNYKWDTFRNKFIKVFVFNINIFKQYIYRNIAIISKYIKNNIKTRINIYLNISKYANISLNTNKILLKYIKNRSIKEEKEKNYIAAYILSNIKKKRKLIKKHLKTKFNNEFLTWKENNITYYLNQILNLEKFNYKYDSNIKNNYFKTLTVLRRKNLKIYKFLYFYQMLIFNKNKFANWFLNYRNFGIINIISKIYKKKVELNIINLKSIHFSSDIYSESISLKLKNRKALFKVKIPRLFDLYNLNKYSNNMVTSKSNLLNNIKYKIISGARFEASGRLTRRLIASRAVFKYRYIGNLKNIYSSFIGLSTVMLRGYVKPNIQYTIINSKTRNGAFGLKGWVSSY
jgi:hypothetical protein